MPTLTTLSAGNGTFFFSPIATNFVSTLCSPFILDTGAYLGALEHRRLTAKHSGLRLPKRPRPIAKMMSRSALRPAARALTRSFASSARAERKVAVLGAAGGIGQPLSLLLKQDTLITSLSLYDIRGAPGVAADISHVNTNSIVKGYEAAE